MLPFNLLENLIPLIIIIAVYFTLLAILNTITQKLIAKMENKTGLKINVVNELTGISTDITKWSVSDQRKILSCIKSKTHLDDSGLVYIQQKKVTEGTSLHTYLSLRTKLQLKGYTTTQEDEILNIVQRTLNEAMEVAKVKFSEQAVRDFFSEHENYLVNILNTHFQNVIDKYNQATPEGKLLDMSFIQRDIVVLKETLLEQLDKIKKEHGGK